MAEHRVNRAEINFTPPRNVVYLDNAASTPVDHQVVESMVPFLELQYGNPSSLHKFGREQNPAIQSARKKVAALVGANPSEITFTSGGTESDNLAIRSALSIRSRDAERTNIIVSSIEHDAILEPCKSLETENGFSVNYLPVTKEGIVEPAALRKAINRK